MFEMKTWTFFFGEQIGFRTTRGSPRTCTTLTITAHYIKTKLFTEHHSYGIQNFEPMILKANATSWDEWNVCKCCPRPPINRFEEATLATMTLPSGGITKVTVPSPVSDGRAECSRLQAGGRVLGQSELTGRSLRRGGRSPPAQGGRRPPRRVRQARQQEVPGSRRRGQDQQRCPTTCSFFSSPLLVFLDGTSCLF